MIESELKDELRFLQDLKLMIALEGTEYPAPWSQVPAKYREEFKSWCGEMKQQTWNGMWDRGWDNYHLEYLASLITDHQYNLKVGKIGEPDA